ncbi:MAG: hypothetical protein ABI591_33280 [Kofleriaceae bacterium]
MAYALHEAPGVMKTGLAVITTIVLTRATTYAQPDPQPTPPVVTELDPFTFADVTWRSGNARTKDAKLGNHVTGELRLDKISRSTEAWCGAENVAHGLPPRERAVLQRRGWRLTLAMLVKL